MLYPIVSVIVVVLVVLIPYLVVRQLLDRHADRTRGVE